MRFTYWLGLLTVLGGWLPAPAGAQAADPQAVLYEETFDAVADGRLPAGWEARDGKWAVERGRLRGEATAYLSKILLPVPAQQDVALEADVTFEHVLDDGRWLALVVRNPQGAAVPHLQFTNRFNRTRPDGVEISSFVEPKGPKMWSVLVRGRAGVPPKLGEAHRLRFEVRGWQARGFIDGKLVSEQVLPADAVVSGRLGLAANSVTATFDNIRVAKLPPLDAAAYRQVLAQTRTSPLVIAHRGNSAHAPENTLESIRQAIALGVDAVEVDINRSKDGVLVLMHDNTVDRTTNGKGKVPDLTLAELKALDAGTKKDPKYAGERIPTLDEACQLAKGKVRLVLDLKGSGYADEIAAIVNKLEMADRVIAACWNLEQAKNIRRALPHTTCKAIIDGGKVPPALDSAFFQSYLDAGVRGFSWNCEALKPEQIRAARLRAMPLFTWTVNNPWMMERMMQMGVDGIYTDDPALLLGVIDQVRRRTWLPETAPESRK